MLEILITGLIVLIIFYGILKLLQISTKMIIRLILNGLVGLILLIFANAIASLAGISQLDIGLFSVIVASIFGIPGVILLFLFN